ncbi:MAG: D-Ala-D-Ala carboxypeptidase family metallohydrolase [Rubrivivax sp.]
MERVVIVLKVAALAVTLASLAGCAGSPRGPLAFASWRAANAAQVTAFERHLGEQGVAQVLPLHQLLRSASSWRECASEPFALPPPEHWGAAVSVLRLLQALQAAGVVGTELEVHSAYRGPALNACAQGAAGSAHLRSFALDFTLPSGPDPTGRLCAFWREHGRAWRMGLSRYPSGRIHIDTAGFRTWGADHTGRSAVCEPPARPATPANSAGG